MEVIEGKDDGLDLGFRGQIASPVVLSDGYVVKRVALFFNYCDGCYYISLRPKVWERLECIGCITLEG